MMFKRLCRELIFFFNDTATPEISTLPLHDALPISGVRRAGWDGRLRCPLAPPARNHSPWPTPSPPRRRQPSRNGRSEEHTSELQSRQYLVCRLLLEKKKTHS